MRYVLTSDLSEQGIDSLIQQIEQYRRELIHKCDILVQRLAQSGIPVINACIARAKGDSDKSHNTEVYLNSDGTIRKANLILTGGDILFIEFGAGIHYNSGNAHPKAGKFGYGVGTYPGQTHAIDPGYWWYMEDGESHFSRGTQATMPMYNASLEIMRNVSEIANEVFN